MSTTSVNPNNPFSYLQSMQQAGSGATSSGASDPLAALFAAFTGSSGGGADSASTNASGGTPPQHGRSAFGR